MRIGELAALAGTSARSLRYYEAQGLLTAARDAKGYRDYGEDDLRVVREIRSLLALGFALEETRPFVECLRDGHEAGDTCPDSIAVYRRKLAELDACLQRMHAVRDQLARQLDHAVEDRADQGRAEQGSGAGTAPSARSHKLEAGTTRGLEAGTARGLEAGSTRGLEGGVAPEPRCFFSV